MSTDVSEEHIASIFRFDEYAVEETNVKAGAKLSASDPTNTYFNFRYKIIVKILFKNR
jgi:hypothetical protein